MHIMTSSGWRPLQVRNSIPEKRVPSMIEQLGLPSAVPGFYATRHIERIDKHLSDMRKIYDAIHSEEEEISPSPSLSVAAE